MSTLLGIDIGVPSLESAVAQAMGAIETRQHQVVFACANSNSMNIARRDRTFRAALQNADQLVADGAGVTLIARLAGKDVGPRIIGQQYYEALMRELQSRGDGRVFYFGSSQSVLDRIRERFAVEYPQLTFCGAVSPPYGDWSDAQNRQFVAAINAARPDALWVGMTAPKQEKWVYQNRDGLEVPVIGSIGAVFDFFAGTVSASPDWIRKLGMEAFYRLAAEPRRLWRRVLVSNVSFVSVGLLTEVLGIGRNRQC